MNALFRPGPMQYIPNFINRKHGREPITYDLPDMEEYLDSTYGITVYQEQVMLLSQKLANFSKGQADQLRKAMGKKNRKLIDEMFPKFLEGCLANNHPEDMVKKIWSDWESFASYAFNKSHSTCYAFLAFQTAYLKAHYPSEFLASVLSHNKNDISKINFFLQEGKRMGIEILGPDINESQLNFSVNKKGQIRFGLSALKGVGEGPVENILTERKERGDFKSVYDMVQRLNLRSVNKKCLDSMVMGGALDCFTDLHRAQYFAPSGTYETYIEQLLRYGQSYQESKTNAQFTLFGDMSDIAISIPQAPSAEPWPLLFAIEREKEITGIYLTGHPLNDYALEIREFVTHTINMSEQIVDVRMRIAGIITDAVHGINQKGNGYCRFTLQDFDGKREVNLSNESYANFKNLIEKGNAVFIECANQKFNGREGTFFKVYSVELLDSVAEKRIKGVKLFLPMSSLDIETLDWLKGILAANAGNHNLKITVVDDIDQKGNIELSAKTNSIKMTNELSKLIIARNFGLKING
jgi:DNA polymerase-3 subunit alpha